MIKINVEEWEEIPKENYKNYLGKGLVPIIEYFDGDSWHIFIKLKGGLRK